MPSIQLTLPFPPEEQWLDIPGWEKLYRISSLGKVQRTKSGRLMKGGMIKTGYRHVQLSSPGQQTFFYVHRLVMLAFAGECPEGMEVNHKNGVKHDNRFENLEYVTRSGNMRHYHASKGTTKPARRKPQSQQPRGFWIRGVANKLAKLNDVKVREIRKLYAAGVTIAELARRYDIKPGTMSYVVHRKTWKHVE